MRYKTKFVPALIFFVVIMLTLSGCPKRPKEIAPPSVEVVPPEAEELTIRGEEFISIPEVKNVYFEYDKFHLTEEAKTILQNNAKFLSENLQYEILVEGHCCECGTNEYNLGLGQKRADTVRNYYIRLGISPTRIATISYGEEKPINRNAGPPDSPLCTVNRRGETKVRVKK